MSSTVREQLVFQTQNWVGGTYWNKDSLTIKNSSGNNQELQQRQGDVATLTFAVGDAARSLVLANYQNYESDQTKTVDVDGNNITIVDDYYGSKDCNSNGLAFEYRAGDDGYHSVWMLSILKEANIDENKTLELSNISGTNNTWSAKVSGYGNIAYSGTGTLNIQTTLANGFDDTNTYTGSTTITGEGGQLTVNLYKGQSFGQTSGVTASNTTINVYQSDAWESTGGLHLKDSTVKFSADQSGFTVKNNPGDTTNTATFGGANTISSSADSFKYLIQGNAEVVGGTTRFDGINITTQVAGSLTLHSVDGIANNNAVEIGESLNFVGAVDTANQQTLLTQTFAAYEDNKYTVNLSGGSNIKYASGSILSGVLTTNLSNVSKLETDNQANLGDLVMFNRQGDKTRSQLTLTLASGVENLSLTTSLSGDGLTILDAGNTNTRISFDSRIDLSNYSGWIRLQNGTMTLTEDAANKLKNDVHTGLSLGSGSTLVINGKDTQTIENFAWSTTSSGGVLDLTSFEFMDSDTAALKVNSIQWGAQNTIKLNLTDFMHDSEVKDGNIFALSNANPFQILVEGKEVPGIGSDTVTVEGIQEANEPQILTHLEGSLNAAEVNWNIGAEHYDSKELADKGLAGKSEGIYLNYSATSLNLLNGAENSQSIDANSALLPDASLVAVASNTQSNSLTTQISGHGILELRYTKGQLEEETKGLVTLSNNSSTYTGATVVRNGVNLESTLGALGKSTLVLIEASDYRLRQGQSEGAATPVTQKLNGILTDNGSHTINVNGNTIEIVGTGLTAESAKNMASGYGNNVGITAGNVLGAGTKLTGGGTFAIGSDDLLTSGINLNAQSAKVFNTYDGVIQLAGKNSTLTIEGDDEVSGGHFATGQNPAGANIVFNQDVTVGDGETGADFIGYSGDLTIGDGKNFMIGESFANLNSDAVLLGNNSAITLSGITGKSFVNSVKTQANGAASTLKLIGSTVTLNGNAGNKDGIDAVLIDENSTLTLVRGKDGNGGFEEFGDDKLSVAFIGVGSLALSRYTLSDSDIRLDNLSGTLALDKSQFTLNKSSTYAVTLLEGSTLSVNGRDLALRSGAAGYKDLTVEAKSTLDLTRATTANATDALFTVNSLSGSTGADLTIKVSESQQGADIENKALLEQDEGWGRLLVDSVSDSGLSSGVKIENAIKADAYGKEIVNGVTGTYSLGSNVANGDVSLTYALTALDLSKGSQLELDAASDATTDARDLGVQLTGSGTLAINNRSHVILTNAEGSTFSGTYDVTKGSTLTLNGAVSAATAKLNGSKLNLGTNQTLTLDGTDATIFFESADLGLTLVGKNVLNGTSNLKGEDADRIVLAKGAGNTLAIQNAASAMNGFEGSWVLEQDSQLTLSDTGTVAVTLDRVNSAEGSKIELTTGTYVLTAEHKDVYGDIKVGQEAKLQLSGWKESDATFTTGTGFLSEAGTISLINGSLVNVAQSQVQNFSGTWQLDQGSTLKVSGVLSDRSSVLLGTGDTVDFANASGSVQTIKTAINGNRSGTLKISGGVYEVDAGTAVNVDSIDVTSGASLSLKNKDQLAANLNVDGTLEYESQTKEDFTFGDTTVTATRAENGQKVLQFNLQGGLLDLGADLDFSQFDGGKLRLISGTYLYDATDSTYFDSTGSKLGFAVGGDGVFQITGNQTVNMTSFSWEARSDAQASGVLDLTGFVSNHINPALNVGELHVDNGGQLKLELNDWVGSLVTDSRGGNILDADGGSSDNRTWVVKADKVTGNAAGLTLKDGDVDVGVGSTTTEFHANSDPTSEVIATGYWGYTAGVDAEGDEQGVYVTYGLRQIELQNAQQGSAALQINGNTATDNVLTAQLIGEGKVSVSGSVIFNYRAALSQPDDYLKGQLTVEEGSSLQTMQSHNLGDVTFTLAEGASYAMGDGSTVSDLEETIVLKAQEDSQVTLNGNTLGLKDESLFDATSKLQTGISPEGKTSVLLALGSIEFANAQNTLGDYTGNLNIAEDGEMIFSGDGSFTLNNLLGSGVATIDTNTTVSDAATFSGTYKVSKNKTLTFNKDSKLHDDASVSLAANAVLDTSVRDGVTKIGTLTTVAGSQLNLGKIAMLGEGYASGALSLGQFNGAGDGKAVINVSVDPNYVASNDLLELDNEAGKTTIVIESAANDLQDKFDLKITGGSIGQDTQTVTGVLKGANGNELGDLTYAYNLEVTSGAVGIHMKADSLALYEEAELVLDSGSNGDTTLDLALTGGLGTVILNQDAGFTFAQANNFGVLNVGALSALKIQKTQTLMEGGLIEGQIQTKGGAGIVLGDNAHLIITKRQSGLTGSITLGGADSTLTLGGDAGNEFGTNAQDSVLAGAVLGEGNLELKNVNGVLNQQIGSKNGDGVSLSIIGDSNVVMDKSETLKESNLSHISIGDQTEGATLIVNATSVGIADAVEVTINENSLLQYNVDVSEASGITGDADNGYQVSGNIGKLSGKGALFINLEDGQEGASADNYELVMKTSSETFEGIFGLSNGTFVFGDAATNRQVNSELAANASTVVAGSGSIFRLEGYQTVKDFYLGSGGILDLSAKANGEQSGTPGSSDNLLIVKDGGQFKASGSGESYIRVDTDNLSAEDTLNGAITFTGDRFASVLAEAVEENTKAPFYQIVDGDIGNISTIVLQDENGNKITDGEYTIKLYQSDHNVADLVGGIGLVTGENGQDLYITQTVLGAKLHQTVVLEGDNVNIGQWLRADAGGVGLTIAQNSNVTLTNSTNSLTGDVNVLGGAVLNLGASNVLGGDIEERSHTSALNIVGTVNFSEDVSQSVGNLAIDASGSLNLGTNGRLDVLLDGKRTSAIIAGAVTGAANAQVRFEQGVVSVVSGADLSGMEGAWSLGESAIMNFNVSADQKALEVTSGHVAGGTIAKTGAGDLILGYNFLNDSKSAVVVNEGSLSVAGWDSNELSLASLSIGATSFDIKGDLNFRDGANVGSFTALEGSTTYIGSRTDQFDGTFYDRKIDGNFNGAGGTLVFNTALGTESSDGDSLTITGDATGNVNLLIHNTTEVKDGYQDLTILSVSGDVENFNPTTEFDADGYAYRLGSTSSEDGTNYFLTSKADGGDSGSDSESMISARLGSLTGFAASFDMFSMSLHDRQGTRPWINPVTGEKTMTSLWMRQTATLENSGNSNGQLDSRNNEYVTMLGGDILQLNSQENGYVFAGLMAGYGTSDYKTESTLSGRFGRTDTDGWMVGAYGGWHQNNPETDRTGLYVAGWVQYANFKADITRSGDPMTVRAEGILASLEAGWVVKAADFLMQSGATQGAFYIEPHAQVTWSGVDSENLSGKNMDIYGQHNITTRLGARFTLETSGETNFSPYLEANWVHNTKDIGARWGDVTSYEEGADNQVEFKLGAETFFTDAFSGYAQIRANWGGDGYNRQEGSLGLKYRF